MEDNKMQGDKFREYLEDLYKGRRSKCHDCKKEGTIGVSLDVVHSDFIGPGNSEQSIWVLCQDCIEKRFPENKR
jgi:hypothetical protein